MSDEGTNSRPDDYKKWLADNPRPNPSRHAVAFRGAQPSVRVVPSINESLLDIKSLLKAGLDQLKLKQGQMTPNDIRLLQGLTQVAEASLRMDAEVQERLTTELAKLTDEEVEAAAADPTRLLTGGER